MDVELAVSFFKVILNKKSLLAHFRSTIKTCSPALILLPSKWMTGDSSDSCKQQKQQTKRKKVWQAGVYCSQHGSVNA